MHIYTIGVTSYYRYFCSISDLDLAFSYGKPTYQNINKLILKISRLYNGANTKVMLVLDEVFLRENHYDLSQLNTKSSNVDVSIAICSISGNNNTPYDPKLPESDANTVVHRLVFKHRNSKEIAIFLCHVKHFLEVENDSNLSINDHMDMPLEKSCYPSGKRPIWIMVSEDTSDEDILEVIMDQITSDYENGVILYDWELAEERQIFIKDWCSN